MDFFGHCFRNEALLTEALTTPSYRMDHPQAADNQRLEFLGDAVLGLLAAERLHAEFPSEAEGALTVRRTHMVSTVALCEAAGRLGLVASLRQSSHAAPLSPHAKTVADAVEAVLGAAYLDGGLAAAKEVFEALDLPARAEAAPWSDNPKGELQVRTQAMRPPRRPEYAVLETAGKAHDPVFTVRVAVEGVGEAVASARSRREAEAKAAAQLLSNMI